MLAATCLTAHDVMLPCAPSLQSLECYQKTSKHFASSITLFEMAHRLESMAISRFSAKELTLDLWVSALNTEKGVSTLERDSLVIKHVVYVGHVL